MKRRLLAAAALGMAAGGAGAGTIYYSTTATGLPAYTSEPTGQPGSRLYLTVGQPPPRPRQRLEAPVALRPSPRRAAAYDRLPDQGIHRLVEAAAHAYGVPHALLLAVMHAESNFNPAARSPVGAVGLMQVMPPTGRRYGVHRDLDDPLTNIDVGARYLRDLLRLFDGDTALAVAAYNAGEGAVLRHGRRIPPYAETRAYVPKVLHLYGRYREALR